MIQFIKYALKNKYFVPVITYFIFQNLKVLGKLGKNKNEINIIVLNEERYRDDLKVLSERKDVNFIVYLQNQGLINSLFLSEIRALTLNDEDIFLKNTNPLIFKAREDLKKYLKYY